MLFLIINLLLTLSLTITTTAASPISQPIPPTSDPFYTIPPNIEHLSPGTILRHRQPPSPIAAFRILPVNLKSTHQILYKTTNTFNNSTATVLTVLIPHNADPSKILSYQVAEDASFANCAPSYAFQLASATSGPFGTLITQAELLLVEAALEQGWVVIVPDHEGPQGAFLANRLAGHAVLDGIRAALQSGGFTGIKHSASVALWGYSGGSVASSFAAELHAQYAPELNIVGVAIGGTVPVIANALTTINGGFGAGLIPPGILGLSYEYPQIRALITQHILPQYKDSFFKAEKQCFVADALQFPFADVFKMVDDPSIFTSEPAASILRENSLGVNVPRAPMYVYKSILDETSPVRDTDDIVELYCSKGTSVYYSRDTVSEHGSLAVTGAPGALAWLRDVLGGKKQSGCVTRTVVSTLLDPRALEIVPSFIVDALLDLLGKPVGPDFFG